MKNAEVKSFDTPDDVRIFPKGRVELINVGGMVLGRATFEPGWKWSESVKPIVHTELCQAPHLQYHMSGVMIVMQDGVRHVVKAGEVSMLPPGHDAWIEGDEAVHLVDFQGMLDYAHTMEKQAQQMSDELRTSEVRHRLILSSVTDGVIGINANGEITFTNPAAGSLLGYVDTEMLGQKAHRLFHHSYPDGSPFPESKCATFQTFQDGRPRTVDTEVFWRKDGTSIPVEYATTPLYQGAALAGTIVVYRDITERKAASDALLRAKDAAEAASRAKSTFLATMSHEIRTPMNGVLGMAELMAHTPLDANQREQLAMIKSSGEVLLTVINDILDFSKIEAGRMEFEKVGFSLHEMAGQTLQVLSPQASAKGLELELDIPADLPDLRLGDPGRLRQVLTNLVGNAIKFTERGWVRVAVSPGAGPNGLRVEVSDTGEGISQEAQAKLFQPFSQADASTTRKHGGTGLGLVISARIIGQMGGRTGVKSELGHGSTFWFELTLPPAKPGEVVDLEDRMPDTLPLLAGKSVLVVDDNAVNRTVACAQMRRWGLRVTEAADGATALAQVQAAVRPDGAGYDLVLLDGMMPGMDGWQLAAAIRKIPACAGLPIIMASSSGTGAARMREENSLFQRFLQKPLRPAQLARALAEVLTGWHSGKVDAARPAARQARVLLVEDTKVNQMVATAMLEKGGHQVTLAKNGVEALAQLNQPDLFDLVLMDCQMPELDGFETTRQLRLRERERGWKPYRVVAMTANAMQGDQDLCLAAGMDGYLVKPVRMEQLLRTVAEAG